MPTYDVFLSYTSADKAAVEAVALRLRGAGFVPFLDKWELVPGESFILALENAMAASETVAVFFGPGGVGAWHEQEKHLALDLVTQARHRRRVIPVILPGGRKEDVEGFLGLRTWVDLTDSEEGFAQLVAGILGEAPGPASSQAGDLEVTTSGPQDEHRKQPRVSPTRLPPSTTKLFGREAELARLDAAWNSTGTEKTNVVTLVAWGGVGKTSLLFEWMNRLSEDGWRGATTVFDWSFYSQGGREQGAPSAEQFVREALRFFGDEVMADSPASAWDKGARLAELVAQQRALLVLDGLEPLQHPPSRGLTPGKLTDPAMEVLLRALARQNPGLCVLTTREAVADLVASRGALTWNLDALSMETADALLVYLLEQEEQGAPPVESTESERVEMWREAKGHALTLQLLGRYVRRALGDSRRWREVELHKADASVQGDHAFHVMSAYERWLSEGTTIDGSTRGLWARTRRWLSSTSKDHNPGQRQLAVLRLLGLFDRPVDPGCIEVLCEAPVIEGLTEPLIDLSTEDWRLVVAELAMLGLVTSADFRSQRVLGFSKERTDRRTGGTTGKPIASSTQEGALLSVSLDAHPLVREYFGQSMKLKNEAAWKEAHRRLFEHLYTNTLHWPEGIDGLQPLYQAVAHGCQARQVRRACVDVYRKRILRGTSQGGFYSANKLGQFGANLGALAWLFEPPWSRPSPILAKSDQAWLLSEAAFNLRALGRLAEAVEPMRVALEQGTEQEDWNNAARRASNLSELEMTRGEVAEALRMAEQSVALADRSKDGFQQIATRTTLADALHHADRRDLALRRFEEAEAMQAKRRPSLPQLKSLPGFRYCSLILHDAERVAWRLEMARGDTLYEAGFAGGGRAPASEGAKEYGLELDACVRALERATQALDWAMERERILAIALDQLTLGRTTMYRKLVDISCPSAVPDQASNRAISAELATVKRYLDAAVDSFRRSGAMHHIPRGLLSRAWLYHLLANPTAAIADLDEAERIASRGPMPIFLADVHLTRARLFRDRAQLTKARELLAELRTRGYHRHDDMLADAEAAAKHWLADVTT